MTDVAIPDDVVVCEQTTLPTAITTLARHLDNAVSGMSPDVISVELTCDRGSARLKFHCYKHKPASGDAA